METEPLRSEDDFVVYIPCASWDERAFDEAIDVCDEENRNDFPLSSRVLREALERS